MLDAGLPNGMREYTTVTRRVRRVGMFDATLVRRAINANQPDRIVLNHLDYVDSKVRDGMLTEEATRFVGLIERGIGTLFGIKRDLVAQQDAVNIRVGIIVCRRILLIRLEDRLTLLRESGHGTDLESRCSIKHGQFGVIRAS